MRIARAKLQSIAPYSQSRHYTESVPKLPKEGADDYERRTWRNRLHTNEKGEVFIPPMSFKNCLTDVAQFLGQQIPGKGKSTYTKHFVVGVLVPQCLELGIKAEDVESEWLFVPADGKRGSGRRVMKCFPLIRQWSGVVEFYLIDDTITPEVFEEHLSEAGKFIGIGRFRPRNNGFYGRFDVKSVDWALG